MESEVVDKLLEALFVNRFPVFRHLDYLQWDNHDGPAGGAWARHSNATSFGRDGMAAAPHLRLALIVLGLKRPDHSVKCGAPLAIFNLTLPQEHFLLLAQVNLVLILLHTLLELLNLPCPQRVTTGGCAGGRVRGACSGALPFEQRQTIRSKMASSSCLCSTPPEMPETERFCASTSSPFARRRRCAAMTGSRLGSLM